MSWSNRWHKEGHRAARFLVGRTGTGEWRSNNPGQITVTHPRHADGVRNAERTRSSHQASGSENPIQKCTRAVETLTAPGALATYWLAPTYARRDAKLNTSRLGVISRNLVPEALWRGAIRGTEESG